MSCVAAWLSLLAAGLLVSAGQLNYFEVDIVHYSSAKAGAFIPLIPLGIGTPPQSMLAIFDTGSSDLIIPDKNGAICRHAQQQCTSSSGFTTGAYDRNHSSSVADMRDSAFNLRYTNGVNFRGSFIHETVTLKDRAVANAQLGLISNGSLPVENPLFPIFGVGPRNGEATRQLYDNVPAQVVKMNLTKSNAFAVYLNDFRGRNGSVLFGAVDYAKFSGQLKEAPVSGARGGGGIPSFAIQFSSLSLVPESNSNIPPGSNKSDTSPVSLFDKPLPPALIDSGNPEILIPSDLVRALSRALKVTGPQIRLSCDARGAKLVFGFNQDTAKIEVPLEMLMLPVLGGRQPGNRQCSLAVAGAGPNQVSLGAPFLQAAYVVFDAGAGKLMLAQAVMNATKSDIREYS